jgi:antitoxin HicB
MKEPVTATEHTYTAEFEPAEEGGYIVRFPSLPDLITEGDTLDEAREMAADLLQSYLELLHERGRPLPPSDSVKGHEPIRVPLTVKIRAA